MISGTRVALTIERRVKQVLLALVDADDVLLTREALINTSCRSRIVGEVAEKRVFLCIGAGRRGVD